MKNAPIRLVVLLGSITMIGIVFTQVFWVSEALDNREEEFNHSVKMALRNVVESLCEINGNDISNNPIDQVASNYFIARTNYSINLSSLAYLLRAEFEKRSLSEDFEYGVYDCQTERMVYGGFVSSGDDQRAPLGRLPKLGNDEYYFGVYFPNKGSGLINGLGFWKFTSLLTVVIMVFFGYAMFVILKQRRLSEIHRDFVNNMTHEFKTPLSTLILSSDVLYREAATDRGKRYASIVKSESQRLQEQVTRFLEINKMEHSDDTIRTRFNVSQIVAKALDRLPPNQKQSMELMADDENLCISGDPITFEKIMFNLVDNAMKYGRYKRVIHIYQISGQACIAVKNDGSPIPQSEWKKVFKKFYRITSGDLHDVKGFGLGLYFVHSAIRKFRGKISLSSNDEFTIFTLNIPLDHG